jgi:hypothetical protein
MEYFETAGRENADRMLEIVKNRVEELSIKNIVLASTKGFTAEKALRLFQETDIKLIIVGVGRDSFPDDLLGRLEEEGHQVCFSRELDYEYSDLVKTAYRRFCQGMKVAPEIAMIAVENGLIQEGVETISVGKWDTAIVLTPTSFENFPDLKINEVLCMPR